MRVLPNLILPKSALLGSRLTSAPAIYIRPDTVPHAAAVRNAALRYCLRTNGSAIIYVAGFSIRIREANRRGENRTFVRIGAACSNEYSFNPGLIPPSVLLMVGRCVFSGPLPV